MSKKITAYDLASLVTSVCQHVIQANEARVAAEAEGWSVEFSIDEGGYVEVKVQGSPSLPPPDATP